MVGRTVHPPAEVLRGDVIPFVASLERAASDSSLWETVIPVWARSTMQCLQIQARSTGLKNVALAPLAARTVGAAFVTPFSTGAGDPWTQLLTPISLSWIGAWTSTLKRASAHVLITVLTSSASRPRREARRAMGGV